MATFTVYFDFTLFETKFSILHNHLRTRAQGLFIFLCTIIFVVVVVNFVTTIVGYVCVHCSFFNCF